MKDKEDGMWRIDREYFFMYYKDILVAPTPMPTTGGCHMNAPQAKKCADTIIAALHWAQNNMSKLNNEDKTND